MQGFRNKYEYFNIFILQKAVLRGEGMSNSTLHEASIMQTFCEKPTQKLHDRV